MVTTHSSKKTELELLEKEVCNCVKCPELVANRTQTVFADGNCDAPLMLIGESPGTNEDKKGIPFVGEAGELLNSILKACKWTRNNVYIVNVLKCHPPQNRNPTDEESANCRGFLDRQIELVKPKFLLLLGSVASKSLLGGFVSSLRGSWHSYKGIPTLVTYHPAFLLRNPQEKKEVGKDLRMLLTLMKA
jgi:DNA polymerase